MEDSGYWENGKWIPETPQAKLRNKLGSVWSLSQMILDERIMSSPKGMELIRAAALTCESNKQAILDLLKEMEK